MAFKLPFLKNFRRGFATNSSSSHSFLYLKEPVPGAHDDHLVDADDFSWNDFRLDTIKEKLFYVLDGRIGGSSWTTRKTETKTWERLYENEPWLRSEMEEDDA